jgi:hypothetical protein
MKLASVVASALSCLILGGCAVDQKKEVSMYRKVLDGPKPVPYAYQPGDPLPLEAALLLANRNDEQLASSGEDYVQERLAGITINPPAMCLRSGRTTSSMVFRMWPTIAALATPPGSAKPCCSISNKQRCSTSFRRIIPF